jgi:hypothetical protein
LLVATDEAGALLPAVDAKNGATGCAITLTDVRAAISHVPSPDGRIITRPTSSSFYTKIGACQHTLTYGETLTQKPSLPPDETTRDSVWLLKYSSA